MMSSIGLGVRQRVDSLESANFLENLQFLPKRADSTGARLADSAAKLSIFRIVRSYLLG